MVLPLICIVGKTGRRVFAIFEAGRADFWLLHVQNMFSTLVLAS